MNKNHLLALLLSVAAVGGARGQNSLPDCLRPRFSHVLPAEHFFPQLPCGSDIVKAEVKLMISVDSTGKVVDATVQYLSLAHTRLARCASLVASEVVKAMSVAAINLPCQVVYSVNIGSLKGADRF